MDIFEMETKAALADMWLHENKMLKAENAKLKEAASKLLTHSCLGEGDYLWTPEYQAAVDALAALLGGKG